jgi:4-alpha-glucanotransferase
VFWDGAGVLPLHAPAGTQRVTLTVTLEGGEHFTEERELASLSALDASEGAGGRRVMLSRTLPFGYHQVRVAIGEQAQTAAIFSAPQRVFQGREGRSWGVFAPTYALHSERSLGIGDLADLEQLATWVGQAGGATLATLPLTATFVSEPFDPSPYAPISRLFFSELYLALDNLPELALAGAEVR